MNIKQIYDQLATSYDKRYIEPIHFIEDAIIKWRLDDILNDSDSIVDIGCGTGHLITIAQIEPSNYLGVDISEKMILEAEKKYPEWEFWNEDACSLVLSNNKFDVVTAVFGQINYIGINDFIEIMDHLLDEGGRFFCVMYTPEYKPDYLNGGTLFYSVEDIHSAFSRTGFDFKLEGLSFPIDEDGLTYDARKAVQTELTESGGLDGCKYWMLSGSRIDAGYI